MKLQSFMLLELSRCLRKYLFCSQKAYAGNACLIIFQKYFVDVINSMYTNIQVSLVKGSLSLFRWSFFMAEEDDLIGSRVIITRGVMTFDCYVFSFFRTFSSGLFRLMIGFTNRDCIWTIFLANFMLNDICVKVECVVISAFTGNNITKPYAEIGASFQQSSQTTSIYPLKKYLS